MIIDEFEVLSTTDSIVSIIHSYRARKYQMVRGNLLNEWLAPIESGYEVLLIEFIVDLKDNGPVRILIGGTAAGTRIKLEINQLSPRATEYAAGLKDAIAQAGLNAPGLNEGENFELRSVQGWPRAKVRGMSRNAYAATINISFKQLSRWEKKYRDKGHDTGWAK